MLLLPIKIVILQKKMLVLPIKLVIFSLTRLVCQSVNSCCMVGEKWCLVNPATSRVVTVGCSCSGLSNKWWFLKTLVIPKLWLVYSRCLLLEIVYYTFVACLLLEMVHKWWLKGSHMTWETLKTVTGWDHPVDHPSHRTAGCPNGLRAFPSDFCFCEDKLVTYTFR